MMKLVFLAAFAAVMGVPEAAAQGLVQRSDWQDRKFETYLPRVNTTVPWLEIDTKTRLPKGDHFLRDEFQGFDHAPCPRRTKLPVKFLASIISHRYILQMSI